MAECIDLMHRTMIAVSERRVVLPLRSVMVMPGDLRHAGQYAGLYRRPRMFRGQTRELDSAQQAAALFIPFGLGAVVRGRARPARSPCSTPPRSPPYARRPPAAWPRGCWRDPDAGDLALLGAGEQARSHLAAMLAVRTLRRIRVWARDAAKAAEFARAEGAKHQITIETAPSVQAAVAGCRHRMHCDQGARSHSPRRVAGTGRAFECRRLQHRRRGGDRHARGREIPILRRLPGVDPQ